MTRETPEWIGKNDDTRIPTRVKLRVFEAYGGKCAECSVKLGPTMPPEYDHTIALVNGGENREGNLRPLCGPCHKPKTAADVAIKKKDRRVKAKHIGAASKRSSFPTARDGKWKAKIGGGFVRRGEE